MTTKQRKRVIYLTVVLIPVVGWLAYRLFYPRLYRVTVLPSLGGNATIPRAINDRGEIVGVAQDPNGDYHLVLWNQARKLRDLGTLEPGRGWQVDINNRGQIAVYKANPRYRPSAFLRDPNGTTHGLDPSDTTVFYGGPLNNQGQVAGKLKAADGSVRLALWDPGQGVTDSDAIVTQKLHILSINDKGQILGRDQKPGGMLQTFLWDPNDGVTAVDMTNCDLNNHSCIVGWRDSHHDGNCMVSWQKDTGYTKLFEGQKGRFSRVMVNDAGQILCDVEMDSPGDTCILWDCDKGRIVLDGQLSQNAKGELRPMGLNDRGSIIAAVLSDDKKRFQAIVMEPIPRRWGE